MKVVKTSDSLRMSYTQAAQGYADNESIESENASTIENSDCSMNENSEKETNEAIKN